MSYFEAKMYQIRFRLGLRGRWGSLQRSSRPPSWIIGPTSKGKGGEARGWEGKGKAKEGWVRERDGKEGEEGKGGEERTGREGRKWRKGTVPRGNLFFPMESRSLD